MTTGQVEETVAREAAAAAEAAKAQLDAAIAAMEIRVQARIREAVERAVEEERGRRMDEERPDPPPGPAPPPAPPAPPAAPPASLMDRDILAALRPQARQPKAATPSAYSGKRKEYQAWKRSIQTYMSAYADVSEDVKMQTIFSYLQSKETTSFCDYMYRKFHPGDAWNCNLRHYWEMIDTKYIDTMEAKDAHGRLTALKQGKRDAADFFSDFEVAFEQAGLDQDNPFLTELVQKAARQSIIGNIYNSGTLPTTYVGWRDRILQLDNMERMFDGMQKLGGYHPSRTHKSDDAMQIDAFRDRECLKCHKKKAEKGTCGSLWHIPNRDASETPKKEWNPKCRHCGENRLDVSKDCKMAWWHKMWHKTPEKGKQQARSVELTDDEVLVRAAKIQAEKEAKEAEDFQESQ